MLLWQLQQEALPEIAIAEESKSYSLELWVEKITRQHCFRNPLATQSAAYNSRAVGWRQREVLRSDSVEKAAKEWLVRLDKWIMLDS